MRAALLCLAACGAHRDPGPPANRGSGAEVPVARVLASGPFRDYGPIWECLYETDPRRHTTPLATYRRTDGTTVALVEFRARPTGATCAVTITGPDGIYLAHSFLCSAARSDEQIDLSDVVVDARGNEVVFHYRSTYRREIGGGKNKWGPPQLADHTITCSFKNRVPTCTVPSPIATYEASGCGDP